MTRPLLFGQFRIGTALDAEFPPIVDKERGDAWKLARRREWAARVVERTLAAGKRVLVTLDAGGPAHAALFSVRAHTLLWTDGRVTEGMPPSLIPEHLAAHIVTRWGADRLLFEGEDRLWHGCPMTPGFLRVDKHCV